MSVIEMGKRLGLGKTESYWLIKKNYFQTITVGNKMRVMIASFEEWYANQCRYHKIDGTPPGAHIKEISMTADELGQLLGISEASAYELIAKGHFEKVDDLAKMRITKESFWNWYAVQTLVAHFINICIDYGIFLLSFYDRCHSYSLLSCATVSATIL